MHQRVVSEIKRDRGSLWAEGMASGCRRSACASRRRTTRLVLRKRGPVYQMHDGS